MRGLATVRGSRGRAALPAGTMERVGKKQDQPGIADSPRTLPQLPGGPGHGWRVHAWIVEGDLFVPRGKPVAQHDLPPPGDEPVRRALAVQWLEPPGPGKTDVLGERSAKQNVDR